MDKLIRVRTTAAHGDLPRRRAGLGPFVRHWTVLEVDAGTFELLAADPALEIDEPDPSDLAAGPEKAPPQKNASGRKKGRGRMDTPPDTPKTA